MPKRKTISFDAMVKFFMQNYNIPTKKDVDRLLARLDRLEILIKRYHAGGRIDHRKTTLTAIDHVFDVIKRSKPGVGFAGIQAETGFDEKKIRNIIFRLYKTGKITRKSRGIYLAA